MFRNNAVTPLNEAATTSDTEFTIAQPISTKKSEHRAFLGAALGYVTCGTILTALPSLVSMNPIAAGFTYCFGAWGLYTGTLATCINPELHAAIQSGKKILGYHPQIPSDVRSPSKNIFLDSDRIIMALQIATAMPANCDTNGFTKTMNHLFSVELPEELRENISFKTARDAVWDKVSRESRQRPLDQFLVIGQMVRYLNQNATVLPGINREAVCQRYENFFTNKIRPYCEEKYSSQEAVFAQNFFNASSNFLRNRGDFNFAELGILNEQMQNSHIHPDVVMTPNRTTTVTGQQNNGGTGVEEIILEDDDSSDHSRNSTRGVVPVEANRMGRYRTNAATPPETIER